VNRKTLTRGHVAFDTRVLFGKISVRLDSPYLRRIASMNKMPTNAFACRASIRRFNIANYELIELLIFVRNNFFERKKKGPGTGLPPHCENTQQSFFFKRDISKLPGYHSTFPTYRGTGT
jgi:hypothetical protein